MLNTPMVSVEPGVPGDAVRQQGAVQKSDAGRKEPLAFKKKLQDCIDQDDTPYGAPAVTVNQAGEAPQENSMAANLTDTESKPQVVGILEGFGMLDDHSDLPPVLPQSGPEAGEPAAEAAKAAEQTLPQAESPEPTGALENYARMLSKDQLSRLPLDQQQMIYKAVGDYLGSFESTNKEPAQTAAMPEDAPATPQAAEAAAEPLALPDKIARLLIRLKTAQQDAAPADPARVAAADTVAPSVEPMQKPAAKPEAAEPQTAMPEAPQTDAPQAAAKPAAAQAVQTPDKEAQAPAPKPEPPADTDAGRAQTSDAASGLQSAVPLAQEKPQSVQPPQKAQSAPGSDFVRDNVMRIVDKMSVQAGDGKYDFDVELKPDFLGKVNIKLSMENGEIRMQIKTDDANVKSLFADQAASMQSALKDKGIAVTNIDVTYQSQMQTGSEQRSFSRQSGDRKPGSRLHVPLDPLAGPGAFETMSALTGYAGDGSSVEYLA